MKTRSAAIFFLGSLTVAGCALVIDLGDEAKLRPLDASTAPADAAPDVDAAPAEVAACGLPDSTNPTCAACIKANCCEESKHCAASPSCSAGFQCVTDCLVQTSCIFGCINKYDGTSEITTCSAFKCPMCTPGTECTKLGACVFNLPDASLLRTVEEGRILEDNEDACKTERARVAASGDSDAGACFQ